MLHQELPPKHRAGVAVERGVEGVVGEVGGDKAVG